MRVTKILMCMYFEDRLRNPGIWNISDYSIYQRNTLNLFIPHRRSRITESIKINRKTGIMCDDAATQNPHLNADGNNFRLAAGKTASNC